MVKEVKKLQVLDNDGRPLKGKDSLKVVQKAMDNHGSSVGKRGMMKYQ